MQESFYEFQVEELSPVEKSLRFEVFVPYVRKKLDQTYQKVAKTAEIPGFRRGKAPRTLVEHHYKKDVESDTFLDIFEETFNDYVEKHDVHLASHPVLQSRSEFDIATSLTYQVKIEVYPTVELKNYKGFSVVEYILPVKESDIDQELSRRAEEAMELKPIEDRTTIADSDMVKLDVDGAIGKERYERKQLWLDLTRPKYEPILGFAKAMIGIPIDAKEQLISWTIPKEERSDAIETEEVHLKVTVLSVHVKQVPIIDDDFAKDTGEANSIEELRQLIKTQLEQRNQTRAKREVRNQFIDALIQANPVPLPPSLVREVAKDYLKERRFELLLRVLETKPEPSMSAELVAKEAYALASRDLAFQFLVQSIAKQEGLEISDDDLQQEFLARADEEGVHVSKIKAKIQHEDPKLLSVRADLLSNKVLNLIQANSQVETKTAEHQ